jgi:formate-nitrite transporter family protein
VPAAPDPEEVYERAEREGHRRLYLSTLEQVATGFIAGVTIIFGIVGLGVATALVEPTAGPGLAKLAGALTFGIGMVFLIVGRSELFSENLFDPVAAAIDEPGLRIWARLGKLWLSTLVFNFVGGGLLTAMLLVDGALPSTSGDVLMEVARDIVDKGWAATLTRAVLAGALITLLSYMLNACDAMVARILVAYLVGFFLALGPFDHVVVSGLHVLYGAWASPELTHGDVVANIALAGIGNLVGGLGLITFTHTAQVSG